MNKSTILVVGLIAILLVINIWISSLGNDACDFGTEKKYNLIQGSYKCKDKYYCVGKSFWTGETDYHEYCHYLIDINYSKYCGVD